MKLSYGITPIAVDLKLVRNAIGSKDRALLTELLKEYWHDDPEVEEGDDPVVTAREALEQMVMGENYSDAHNAGSEFGYAFECLCVHFGEYLNNDRSQGGYRWREVVEAALKPLGPGALSIIDALYFRGSPIEIPKADDFPGIGYVLAGELEDMRGKLVEAEEKIGDPEVNESVAQWRGWLETCLARGCDLVCFYY